MSAKNTILFDELIVCRTKKTTKCSVKVIKLFLVGNREAKLALKCLDRAEAKYIESS